MIHILVIENIVKYEHTMNIFTNIIKIICINNFFHLQTFILGKTAAFRGGNTCDVKTVKYSTRNRDYS